MVRHLSGTIDAGYASKSYGGAAAVDWGHTSIDMIQTMACQTIRDGYGVFMTYDLRVSTNPSLVRAMTTALEGRW
ncbi:endo-beta-N-acetylglucosaminidase H [Cutibacterium acnes JCM 18909]|nr:endo-beta-N-acetylglucosaminidase H [Cutibacterium acnes JCM 18909]